MNDYVLEVAVFSVKEEYIHRIPQIRNGLRKALKDFKGLLQVDSYSPVGDDRVFADIAKWESLENAIVASQAFESGDPRFLPYLEAIAEIKFFGHFKLS
ncbi:MAG: hypothetical protein HY080_07530 [Gammaproteobacteria bacterium]|nr:hypothetical protein [Gammaproteobacteria bacterium]